MAKVKDKHRILKAAREKQLVMCKGPAITLSADFSTETLQAKRDCHKIFKVMKSKDLQSRLLYPAKLSFRIKRDKKLPKQEKAEEVYHHQISVIRNVKELL